MTTSVIADVPAMRPLRETDEAWALPLTVGSPSILLVDDNLGTLRAVGGMLAGLGRVRTASSGKDAIRQAQEAVPDVVLVNADMRDMNGFEFCTRVKADPLLAGVPVILVTGRRDAATEVAGFAVGAADFIQKPPVAEVVQARVRTQLRLKELADALSRAALADPLTGVATRRCFDEDLHAECQRARRSGQTLSLLMIDIDHFKRYNDRCGQVEGDDCLRRVATALQSAVHRPADRLARYRGAAFAVLLPDTDPEGATHVARQIVTAIAALRIPHPCASPAAILTVSVGVAAGRRPPEGKRNLLTSPALVAAADQALREAKNAGRARWWIHGAAARPELP